MANKFPSLKEVICNLCGADEAATVAVQRNYRMVECNECGFIYLNPRPVDSSFEKLYEDYHPQRMENPFLWKAYMQNVFVRTAGILENMLPKKGAVLDIGCGFGFFVEEMWQRGWDAKGIDLSQGAVDFAKGRGLEVSLASIEKVEYPDGCFDAVTMFYVLEHLPETTKTLALVRKLLRPGGVLVVRVPHTTPIVRLLEFFGIKNNLYDSPFHLSDFSPKTIRKMLKKSGFGMINTFIGGGTFPKKTAPRLTSIISTSVAESLCSLSGSRILLPGVSKTTVAKKI